MGTVYEAVDERLDATVALKETLFDDDTLRKQFEREARLLARLHHPALPKVSDHFVESDGQFLVMQFIEGDDLDAMRRRSGGRIPLGDVLKWADQLLDALDYLHSQDPPVLHRDIKPQNLKLTPRGQIILLDFGLAKGFTGTATNVTLVKSFFGFTPMYAPLEQIRGTGTDPRSDLYSLAATLYHLLTGVAPPDALSRVTATTEGENDPLLPASQLTEQVFPSVSDVLNKAMMVGRNKRFGNALEMRIALAQAGTTPFGVGNEAEGLATTVVDAIPSEHKAVQNQRGKWDEYSFFEEASKHVKPYELEAMRRLYDYSIKYARVSWGTGGRKGTFNAKFDHINSKSLYSVATNGDMYLNFAWVVDTQAGAEATERLGPRLRQLRGFNIPSNYSEKYITVSPASWVNQVNAFIEIVEDIIQPERNSERGIAEEDEQTIVARPMHDAVERPEGEVRTESSYNSEDAARIDEPVIAININQQYPKSKTAEELYHATRGIWRLSRRRAERARYAFAVYQGVIKEVYAIHRWMPATTETTEYWDRRSASQGKYFPSEVNEGRSEFVGELASEAIRQKYLDRRLPKRHSQNPILYFNC